MLIILKSVFYSYLLKILDEIDLTKLETKDIKKMATHQEYANLKILKLKHINEIDTQVLHDIQIKLTDFQIENDQLKNEIKELNYSLENKKIETNCESCQNMEPNNDKFEEILLEIKNLSIDIYNMMQLFEDGEQINKDKLKDCKKETTQVKLRLKRITEESRILRMRLTAAETKN
ncbi:hypothetical protein A3Q56_03805 [Intoshia linei]|uniref:Uncharacterized protein n=1 Tax=Intoshia linei TaxID=1819745 RepID=A0A177B3Z5_9BILA|nr:hypothetical protein A3Q56_03805 [Intoshia linei]